MADHPASQAPIPLEAGALAAFFPHRTTKSRDVVLVPQMQHRIDLAKYWDVKEGENVLEIGCGQGDCTLVLAAAVGDSGRVTAIDPASLDYGSPYTLGQAQAHISASPLGPRISFMQADPLAFLAASTETYDLAVLSHCIWYFSSPDFLRQLFAALGPRAARICVAEYALTSSDPRSTPHVLAVLAQASLECRKPQSTSNVRTVLSPRAIDEVARDVGLRRVREKTFHPHEGLKDGEWEVWHVVGERFAKEIEECVADAREKAVVHALRDSVRAVVDPSRRADVKTMDVWTACYDIA